LRMRSNNSCAPPNLLHIASPAALPSVTQVTLVGAQVHAKIPPTAAIRPAAHRYCGIQLGPISSRKALGVAQGAALAKRFTQSGPAPIFTRSGVNSGESVLAIKA